LRIGGPNLHVPSESLIPYLLSDFRVLLLQFWGGSRIPFACFWCRRFARACLRRADLHWAPGGGQLPARPPGRGRAAASSLHQAQACCARSCSCAPCLRQHLPQRSADLGRARPSGRAAACAAAASSSHRRGRLSSGRTGRPPARGAAVTVRPPATRTAPPAPSAGSSSSSGRRPFCSSKLLVLSCARVSCACVDSFLQVHSVCV